MHGVVFVILGVLAMATLWFYWSHTRKENQKTIRDNSEYSAMLEAMDQVPVAFVVYDADNKMITCNRRFRDIYGYPEDLAKPGVHRDTLGRFDVTRGVTVVGGSSEDYIEARNAYRDVLTDQQLVLLSDGRMISTQERPTATGGFVSIQIDITEHKLAQENLEKLASIDELTGCLNRRAGMQLLQQFIKEYQNSTKDLSICYIDLDDLKEANDRHGHETGDWLLQAFVKAAQEVITSRDTLIRHGGDEFLLIFPDQPADTVEEKVASIRQRFAKTKQPHEIDLKLNFSLGIAMYNANQFENAESFVAHADRLMYQDKHHRMGSENG